MKKNITISVDVKAYEKAKELGVNISAVCSEALGVAVWGAAPAIQQKLAEVESLQEKDTAFNQGKEKYQKEFVETTAPDIVLPNQEGALMYWARKTGLSLDKLRELKNRPINRT